MKKLLMITAVLAFASSCAGHKKKETGELVDKKTIGVLPTEKQPDLVKVASFEGAQVTGVTISESGRLFANFPRWRKNVPYSVVEVMPDGSHKPYPDMSWNSWQGKPKKNGFTCVQSVVAHKNSLFVLDPSNPEMKGVVGKPTLYEFDLATNQLKRSWSFDKTAAPETSYLNDLRIDDQKQMIYITDSGLGGIVTLDMRNGATRRLLDKHPSTKAEPVVLTVAKKPFLMNGKPARIHSDGIALSPDKSELYYHSLTGYTLYKIPTDQLAAKQGNTEALNAQVSNMGMTPAPDGMIFDEKGNLYMADLERNAVSYRRPDGQMMILIQDQRLEWPDTFTIDKRKNELIFTDSLLQAAGVGKPVEGMTFNIYKVRLPETL